MNTTNWNEIIYDSIRFCSHIFLLHTLGYLFNDETSFIEMKLIRTLIFTVVSIATYHLVIKKIIYKDK